HHLWRYAAWLHGVDEALLTRSPEEEGQLYEAILARQQRTNEDSLALANAVFAGLAGQAPLYFSQRALRAIARAMLPAALGVECVPTVDLLMDAVVAGVARASRIHSWAHFRVPCANRAAEKLHFELARMALEENLGGADRREFRGMA